MSSSYPYKVRVLAAIDSHFAPKHPTKAITVQSIESTFEGICKENNIRIPTTWKKRVQLILDELVRDGWIIKKDSDAYIISPRLRKIIANEKLALEVSLSNHDLKTLAAVVKTLKTASITDKEQGQELPVASSSQVNIPTSVSRRRSARFSLPAIQEQGENQENGYQSRSVSDAIVVRHTSAKKGRKSDPGPRLLHTDTSSSRRRSSSGNLSVASTSTPGLSKRKRSKHPNRRHTMPAAPVLQPMSMPSGVYKEIQFFPLKQALSNRTRRSLRRNALSEEMNNIDAEKKAAGSKKHQELLALRAELAASEQRLRELERQLMTARHAPSEEPGQLETVMEESEADGMDMDTDMDMGFGIMDFGEDHADDTLAHSLTLEDRTTTPEIIPKQADSNGQTTPASRRDQRIRDLEAQISSLREDIQQRVLEAQRRQEEDEVFHDAEEQILVEENISLADRLEQRRDALARGMEFDESTVIKEDVEVETIMEESIFGEGMSMMTDDLSSIGGDTPFRVFGRGGGTSSNMLMEIEEEEEEEGARPDLRIADLQWENEKLQQALGHLNDKLRELEDEAETAFATSEEIRRKAETFYKENEILRTLGDRLAARITELEELEGERLQSVASGAIQTDEFIDEEKENLAIKITQLQAQIDELENMQATISEQKRRTDASVAEQNAIIEGLQQAVEVGSMEKEDVEGEMEGYKSRAKALEAKQVEDENDMASLQEEITALVEELEGFRLENVELQEQLADKSMEIESLTRQMEEINSRIAGFEFNVDSLREEIRIANLQLAEKDQTIEVLESERETLQNELEDLQSGKSALEVDVDQLETNIEEANQKIEDVYSQIAVKDREIQELMHAKGSALEDSAEKEAAISSLEQEREALEQQVNDLKVDVDDLNDALSDLRELVVKKEQAVQDLQAVQASLEGELSEKKQTIDNLEQQNASLLDEIKVVGGNVADLKQEKASLSIHAGRLESNVDELNTKVSDLGRNNLNLAGQLTQHTGENTVLKNKILGLDDINEALKTANELLQNDKNFLEGMVKDLEDASVISQDQNIALRQKIGSLEQQISGLEDAAEASKKVKEELEDTISGLRNRISTLEKAADVLEKEKESFERDINRLEIKVSELEADLKTASSEKEGLNNEILETRAQIEIFKQSIAAFELEKERMEDHIAGLYAEVEASKKAIRVADTENMDLEDKIETLEERIEGLEEEIEALKSEKELMRRDIADYQFQIADLTRLLEISRKDNESLRQSINALEDMVTSLQSSLMSSTSANTENQQELKKLQAQIAELSREAQAVDEEKSIIAQKIQPYINGELPLDMAVDEVLTELVMVQNQASENDRLRRQLENKIRILAQDGDGEISPEEVIERLTDRFKAIRKRVETLFNQRRQLEDSHWAGHGLEDFTWTGSNDRALQVLETLIEEFDNKIFDAREGAKILQSSLDLEKNHSIALGGYLDEIVTSLGISDSCLKHEIPSFIERHVLELESQIKSCEDQVADLEELVRTKETIIKGLEADLEYASFQKSNVDQELVEAQTISEITNTHLTVAQRQIAELNAAAEEDRMEIDGLEQEISARKLAEQKLLQQLDEQSTSHMDELKKMHHEKVVAVAAVENKLAEAIDGRNHLQTCLATAIAEHASHVHELEGVTIRSKEQIQDLDNHIANAERDHEAEVEEFQSRINTADHDINELQRKLGEATAQANVNIATLQTKLDDARAGANARNNALEARLAEQKAFSEKLESQLEERIAEIEGLTLEIAEMKHRNAKQREALEENIDSLERKLQTALFEAGKEKVRLELVIQDDKQRFAELETKASELEEWLNEAETREGQLEESLKQEESEHQLFAEESSKEKALLLDQKAEVQALLEQTQAEKARVETELRANIDALHTLIDKKKQEIEGIRANLAACEVEKHTLELKVIQLESEKYDLEEDLRIERKKGREAVESMQQEAQKFLNRFGDSKGQYIREQKQRESKKRRLTEATSSSQEEQWLKEPLSPASTTRRMLGTGETIKKPKRRRLYGDSGIGVEPEEDEGFEGSVSMAGA